MSARHAGAMRRIQELALVFFLALLSPLLVAFFVYLIGTAAAAAHVMPVGYGLTTAFSGGASGVSYFWVLGAAPTSSDPSLPTIAFNALNAILVLLAVVTAVLTGIKLAPALLESLEERAT